ncbi:outer membrane protein [Mesorhizobium sp.]|uniref:outer membrane protein n=2 Tax=Mesorhizobium sp. TaxID=1871066 RepID=UPI000FE60D05|nr:outer membrane beta-barrel protein [Mesorhizobium sp.]RWI11867.1 MAG: porin family protein [Mesorhizobium sp.]RWK44921.1 MAG: porin family protein [Mesorhizobium sp.]RWK92920.1 MAG: porin family protein [Mesorhizobium sp.]TIP55147.1 MAG: porin family protein [Mesorhizobium sp.]TIQ91393.1 MAG: porin family protein [Mesorhizobium sp.]
MVWLASRTDGYAAGQFMPFVTGGLAIGRYEISETPFSPCTKSKTYTGWTLGAGADYAVTNHILLRAAYRYTDYGDEDFTDIFPWPDSKVDLSTSDVRVGIAYKF